jgi:hypothetical protein
MHSSSISKLSQFWINWKINKTTLAPVDSLTDRTALGPHRPPQIVAATNLPCQWFPAAVSLPPDSPSHRPPSTASTGYNRSPTHHEQPFFLPPVAPTVPPCSAAIEPPCSAAPGSPLSSPSPPRAPHRRVPPSRTVSHQPSPLDAAPTVVPLRLTAHRCGGPPPPFDPPVGCAVLPSRPSAPPVPPPPPTSRSRPGRHQCRHWPSALPMFGRDGPPAQSSWASRSRPAEFGPFAQYHLPFFHPIKH